LTPKQLRQRALDHLEQAKRDLCTAAVLDSTFPHGRTASGQPITEAVITEAVTEAEAGYGAKTDE
jgi:hypothetical protein